MALLPPNNYFTLQQASTQVHSEVNIIGVVVHLEEPSKTRGTDYLLPIVLRDPSLPGGSSPEGLKVKFFKQRIEDFPPISGTGDVVIIRRCKPKARISDRIIVDSFNTLVFVFKVNTIPQSLFDTDFTSIDQSLIGSLKYELNKPNAKVFLSNDERKYVLFLWKWIGEENVGPSISRANDAIERPAMNSASKVVTAAYKKHALLEQVQPAKFYDLTVEVVRIHKNFDMCTIYVTDYTSNSLFYNYTNEDELNQINPAYTTDQMTGKKIWKGPAGKMALQITLWPPHSEFANDNLNEGSMIDLRNVNIVHNKNAMNILEGKLHTDRKYEQRINIALANENSVTCRELLSRKDEYWKKHLSPTIGLQNDQQGDNSKQRRKRARQQKKEQERRELQEKEKTVMVGDPFTTSKSSVLNTNIATGYEAKEPQPLHTILHSSHLLGKTLSGDHITYPFMNVTFRSQVRVVDFFPPKLEDFAHSLDDVDYNDLPDPSADDSYMDMDMTPSPRWEWAFWLLLEDAKKNSRGEYEQMKILIHGLDAEYLLKLTACNLRESKMVLSQLREKLFVMWGELEEYKTAGRLDHSNRPAVKPFECCIQEYGVPDGHGGWTRLHRMFHTVIK